jgi:hypothetical protein
MKSSIARLRAGLRLATWLVNCGSHSRTDGRDVLQVEHGPLSVVRCIMAGWGTVVFTRVFTLL